jgi:esterase/lipase superfamily enzyme
MSIKKISLSLLVFLVACSHSEVKKTEFKFDNKNESQTYEKKLETPKLETPPIKEITNFDIDFQNSLKNVWGTYFRENYNDSRSVDIFIATNRKPRTKNFGCSNESFGNIEDPEQNILKFGICRINVPKNHSTGVIEYSESIKANSNNFFKIINAKNVSEETMFQFFKRTKRTPLVFVHGFNVRYQDAVLRAAQISYDLKYQGPVILFTWPSGPGDGFLDDNLLTRTYESNRKSAANSIQLFKELINSFIENDMPINLVVHSMGHQVVLPALSQMGDEDILEDKPVRELILNAPDFEVNDFKSKIEALKNISSRITLYCSFNDKAMSVSSTFNKTSRLGSCARFEGVDTINVSSIDNNTFGTGHSYYSSRDIITDVFQVLLGLDVEKRLFMKKGETNGTENFFLRN